MGKRINIVLPELTIRTIDRMVKPGQRSLFINHAVQYFVAHRSPEALRSQLEMAVLRDQDLDREVSADWLAVDQQTWQQPDESTTHKKPATRSGEKSISRRLIQR
jgi:hypothetical protein